MTGNKTTVALAVVLLIGSVIVAGATVAATHAYFSDTETAQGSVVAAEDFGYTGEGACIDEDGDGECEPGETVVDKGNLSTYSNTSVDLVIPENVGQVGGENTNDPISVTANSITSEVDFASKNKDISLEATGGDIDFGDNGVTISQGGGSVTIDAAGDVDMSDSDITTENGDINITAGGSLDLSDSSITVTKKADVLLTSGLDTDLTRASIDIAKGGNSVAEATLSGSSGTLFVDNATFSNEANPFEYDSDFTVNGSVSSGSLCQQQSC